MTPLPSHFIGARGEWPPIFTPLHLTGVIIIAPNLGSDHVPQIVLWDVGMIGHRVETKATVSDPPNLGRQHVSFIYPHTCVCLHAHTHSVTGESLNTLLPAHLSINMTKWQNLTTAHNSQNVCIDTFGQLEKDFLAR